MTADLSNISLHRVSTAEAIADTLVGLIVSGSIQAGEPLRESALATRFGVSRNSLREAIRLLEQSRLVKHEIHRGAIVTSPTQADLEDLHRTRMQLELAGIQQVPTEEQLTRLDAAFETLRRSSDQNVAEPIVDADLALHRAIVGFLGSERIDSFYRAICQELVFYFRVLSYTDEEYVKPKESVLEHHRPLYEAIRTGDRATAATLLRSHLESNYERLREILAARTANS